MEAVIRASTVKEWVERGFLHRAVGVMVLRGNGKGGRDKLLLPPITGGAGGAEMVTAFDVKTDVRIRIVPAEVESVQWVPFSALTSLMGGNGLTSNCLVLLRSNPFS